MTTKSYDVHGMMTYSLVRLSDISNLVAYQSIRYELCGPNQDRLYPFVNGICEYSGILGDREIQILKHIGDGHSSKTIGELLSISKHTVDTHR